MPKAEQESHLAQHVAYAICAAPSGWIMPVIRPEAPSRDNIITVRLLLLTTLLPLLLGADDHWSSVSSGPFEVFSNASTKSARETLVRFEQLRHALGQLTGDTDLTTPQPIRII